MDENMIKIGVYTIVAAILLLPGAVSITDLLGLQGNVNSTGASDIAVQIWDSSGGGNLIYDSSTLYDGAVQNGRYDLLLGTGATPLELYYGRLYYLDMEIDSQDVDFNHQDRYNRCISPGPWH